MRILAWILRIIVFLALFLFALKNTDTVSVRLYFDQVWQAPLILVLLVVFCAGIALGLATALGPMFRQRREIAELKRRLRELAPRESGTGNGMTKARDGRLDGN